MTTSSFKDGKVILHRSTADKKPIIQRLNRIEGQVRGLKAMIEEDRYCLDELTQIKATISALRVVAAIITEQHVKAGISLAVRESKAKGTEVDIMKVLNSLLKI
jgi:DNA-binding FrmR family transcriptional regulator